MSNGEKGQGERSLSLSLSGAPTLLIGIALPGPRVHEAVIEI